jgi:hypothetical protein
MIDLDKTQQTLIEKGLLKQPALQIQIKKNVIFLTMDMNVFLSYIHLITYNIM